MVIYLSYFHPFINTHHHYQYKHNHEKTLVEFRCSDFPFRGSNHSEDFSFGIVNCRFDRLTEWIN